MLKQLHDPIGQGEVVVVCGPSGSGKSTLIKCVNALEDFQDGEITVDGVSVGIAKTDLPKLRARVGMVFQHFELFPHFSIIDNLVLAQEKVLGRRRREATEKGRALLDRVGLKAMRDKYPAATFRRPAAAGRDRPRARRWIRSPCCSTSRPRRSIPK